MDYAAAETAQKNAQLQNIYADMMATQREYQRAMAALAKKREGVVEEIGESKRRVQAYTERTVREYQDKVVAMQLQALEEMTRQSHIPGNLQLQDPPPPTVSLLTQQDLLGGAGY